MFYMFITHDLSVAYYFSYEGRMAIMYVERIVEFGERSRIRAFASVYEGFALGDTCS